MAKSHDRQIGNPADSSPTGSDEQLADLPDTVITPEQVSQVKGGVEYPNLTTKLRGGVPQLKFDTEVVDY